MRRISWELIVDCARGLADEQQRAAVESDPVAQRLATLMAQVWEATQEVTPEIYLNRAKGLLPQLPPQRVPALGKLVFSSEGASAGFRSGATMARDLQFDFGVGGVDLRLEPLGATGMLIIGVALMEWPHHVRVTAPTGDQTWTEAAGEFQLVLPQVVHRLTFENVMTGEFFEVEFT